MHSQRSLHSLPNTIALANTPFTGFVRGKATISSALRTKWLRVQPSSRFEFVAVIARALKRDTEFDAQRASGEAAHS